MVNRYFFEHTDSPVKFNSIQFNLLKSTLSSAWPITTPIIECINTLKYSYSKTARLTKTKHKQGEVNVTADSKTKNRNNKEVSIYRIEYSLLLLPPPTLLLT